MRRISSPFNDTDRTDHKTIIERIKELQIDALKNTYEIARYMVQVRARGLWALEKDCQDIYQWIEEHFGILKRQADTYLLIGTMKEQRVVESGLTLEYLDVVGRGPELLQDKLIEVARRKVPLKVLRAGC